MKKILTKRKKKTPFDYQASENYVLPSDAKSDINNSYYFSAHNEECSFFCRLGLRISHKELWFFYSDKSVRLAFDDLCFNGDSPLETHKTANGWAVNFNGKATDNNGKDVSVEFSADFTAIEEPIDFFSSMATVRTAIAMAGEKWNKKFFGEVQKNNQVHYEEFGYLQGKIKIDGVEKQVNVPCVRDHSFGMRDWDYMNNHLWLMAVNEKSQLNFSMVSYPAMSILEVGNFKAKDKKMAFVISAEYDRSSISKGYAPEELSVKLKLDDKSVLNVKAVKKDQVVYDFQNGDYRLIEGTAEFEINGERYHGILEVGINKDKTRVFNGKPIKKLKV